MLLHAIAAAIALSTPPHAPSAAEVTRVQEHLDGALRLIAARDHSVLSEAQRTRRDALVQTLRAYRDAGRFPINRHFPGQQLPYFRDSETGVLCAVGFLLASTERHELIEEIVATDNHVRVRGLAGHAEFRRWLEEHGLLLEEAARIQPAYGNPGPTPATPGPRVAPSTLEASAVVATSFAVAGMLVPALKQPSVLPFAGLAVGVTAVVLGLRGADHEATRTMAMVNVGVGALGAILAGRTLSTRQRERTAHRVTVTPFLGVGATRRGMTPGLALVLSF